MLLDLSEHLLINKRNPVYDRTEKKHALHKDKYE